MAFGMKGATHADINAQLAESNLNAMRQKCLDAIAISATASTWTHKSARKLAART
jgi:hypothetical protein